MHAAIKLFKKIRLVAIAAAILAAGCTACVNYYGYTYDDDEWSNGDYNSENLLLNGEVDIDDFER